MDIKGAVVFVTGASSGIGEATARAASKAGAHVVLAVRRQDRLEVLAAELGEALPVRCDVTDPVQVTEAVRTTMDRFGRSMCLSTMPVMDFRPRSTTSKSTTSASSSTSISSAP